MIVQATKRKRRLQNGRRSLVERKALCALLVMAWSWIIGFFVVYYFCFYHQNGSAQLVTGEEINPRAFESPLLVFTCERANYLSETLADVYRYLPQPCRFGCPIIVSEDGNHPDIARVVQEYQQKFLDAGVPLYHLHHERSTLRQNPYEALAQHYGWALGKIFDGTYEEQGQIMPAAQRVVILEEDLHIATDFFEYFEAMSYLLDTDETLLAVSAFNDNGQFSVSPSHVLRSDFFPGLGWMMNRNLWENELSGHWPSGYWDDWLREPAQRKDRQILRPEYSRTFHFGAKGGASANQFGSLLQKVKLNEEFTHFTSEDLSYLKPKFFATQYSKQVKHSEKVSTVDEALKKVKDGNVWLQYQDYPEFKGFAQQLNIMDDEKAMVPRTSYYGIVEVKPFGMHRIFLTPPVEKLKEHLKGIDKP